MKKLITLILLSLVFIACEDDPVSLDDKKIITDLGNLSTKCGDEIKTVQDTFGLPRDLFDLKETTIDGNCMTLRLDYGGGCGGKVDFQLYYFGEYELDSIPHYEIYIALDDEDPCEALKEKQVKFDMTEFKKQVKSSVYYINFVNANDSLLIGA